MNAKRITDRSFFTCPAEELAPKLLGEALYIDYEQLNQADLTSSNDIWLEDDGFQVNGKYLKLKRIGLDSAKDISPEDKNRLLRFRLQK